MASFEDFLALDIRAGQIIACEPFEGAKKPALKLLIDFGPALGLKKSSAQITELYRPDDLVGRQILAVVNFPPRQIAHFISEVLVLGLYSEQGVVLIVPEQGGKNGDRLG